MRSPPSLPRITCPKIDKIISMIEELQAFAPEDDQSYTGNLERSVIELLEEVRQANSDLRENAEHYIEECEKLEKTVAEQERRIDDLADELHDLNEEIKELSNEIENLERNISELESTYEKLT